jgi:Ribbon-helix-helix domain
MVISFVVDRVRPSSVLSPPSGAACYWTPTTLDLCTTYVKEYEVTPAKVGKQIRLISYYRPEAFDQLKRLSAATRIPQSVYLREALDDLLKKYAGTLRKGASAKQKGD